MKCYEFTVEEIVRDTSPLMSQNVYLKVRDSNGVFIAFWGRPKNILSLPKDMDNIEAIKSSPLPIKVKIECDYRLEAEPHLSKKLGIRFSVSEGTSIEIINEPAGA